jgi:hypothetical protein
MAPMSAEVVTPIPIYLWHMDIGEKDHDILGVDSCVPIANRSATLFCEIGRRKSFKHGGNSFISYIFHVPMNTCNVLSGKSESRLVL